MKVLDGRGCALLVILIVWAVLFGAFVLSGLWMEPPL